MTRQTDRPAYRLDPARTLTFDPRHAYHINGQTLIDTMRHGGYDQFTVTQDAAGAVVVTFGWRETDDDALTQAHQDARQGDATKATS